MCPTKYKMATLLKLLQTETAKQPGETVVPSKKIIVYFATCACVDYFYKVSPAFYLYDEPGRRF